MVDLEWKNPTKMDDDWGVAPFQETFIYDDHLTMGYTKCIDMFFLLLLVFQMGDSSAKNASPNLILLS